MCHTQNSRTLDWVLCCRPPAKKHFHCKTKIGEEAEHISWKDRKKIRGFFVCFTYEAFSFLWRKNRLRLHHLFRYTQKNERKRHQNEIFYVRGSEKGDGGRWGRLEGQGGDEIYYDLTMWHRNVSGNMKHLLYHIAPCSPRSSHLPTLWHIKIGMFYREHEAYTEAAAAHLSSHLLCFLNIK